METPKRWANTPIPPRSCGDSLAAMSPRALLPDGAARLGASLRFVAVHLLALCLVLPAVAGAQRKKPPRPPKAAPKSRGIPRATEPASAAAGSVAEKKLAQLARAVHTEESPRAYARLAEFAQANSTTELGARAALALGYYDFTKGRHKEAQQWLAKAQPRELLLREYVLYWQAQAHRALGRDAEALAELETFRREFPESVITEQAVQSLAEAALALGKPDRAVAALEAYDRAGSKAPLLLLRAQAEEKVSPAKEKSLAAAARDFLAVYYRFPLSDEATAAGARLPALQRALREEFPGVPMEQQVGRAAAFFEARRWRDARAEYAKLLPKLFGPERQRAELRIAECRVQLGASPAVLASLVVTDPETDAGRLFALSQAYRSKKKEGEMLAAIERVAERYPQTRWAEDGLYAAGNYFWVNLDRQRAAAYYRRLFERFPVGKYSQAAQWRLAWLAYLDRRPEAAAMMEEHLRRFPGSPYTANALYWMGRAAERAGNVPHARSFYLKAQERLPQTYFGRLAAERLRAEPAGIGTGPVNAADVLALIPAPPRLPSLDEAIPPSAAGRWARAQALRTIAFDASAELELRAAYALTGVLRLLWESGEAASDAGRFTVGIATARLVYPQLEARTLDEVPREVWRSVFPLPYELSLKRAAARNHVEPMLVAGLIRQESVFQADAISRAGAVGLMQVLPKTGRLLARRLKVGYARAKLFDPEYNLLLGTLYLGDLVRAQATAEAALAAYNAGEERVAAWQAERRYDEPAEFVESIPFTETREYVQIVMRNADVYRQLYGPASR